MPNKALKQGERSLKEVKYYRDAFVILKFQCLIERIIIMEMNAVNVYH